MPIKRSYAEQGDGCATAHAMEVLGDRWTYPILRELMLAPKRFTELAAGLQGITPAVLTARLRELEAAGLICKSVLPPPAGVTVYDTTEWAHELEPTLQALGRWAQKSPTMSGQGGLTPDSAIQSMHTMVPAAVVRPAIELQLNLFDARVREHPGYTYRVSWSGRRFIAERGENPQATATVTADSSTWIEFLFAGHDPAEPALLQMDGDRETVRRLVEPFRAGADRFRR